MKKLFLLLFIIGCASIEYTKLVDLQIKDMEIIDDYILFTITMYNSTGSCNWKSGDFFFDIKDSSNKTIKKGNMYVRKFKNACMNLDDSARIYVGKRANEVTLFEYRYINYDREMAEGSIII